MYVTVMDLSGMRLLVDTTYFVNSLAPLLNALFEKVLIMNLLDLCKRSNVGPRVGIG